MIRRTWRLLRRLSVLLAGACVVCVGLVMLVTPGPAVVVIPLGLAILASEFDWARRLLRRFSQEARDAADRAGGWWRRRSGSEQQRGAEPEEGDEADHIGDGRQHHAAGQGRVDPQPPQGRRQRHAD